MNERAPQLGETVLYTLPAYEASAGGVRVFAAIVTKVWDAKCVNLRLVEDEVQLVTFRPQVEHCTLGGLSGTFDYKP